MYSHLLQDCKKRLCSNCTWCYKTSSKRVNLRNISTILIQTVTLTEFQGYQVSQDTQIPHHSKPMILIGRFHLHHVHLHDISRTKFFHTCKLHTVTVSARATSLVVWPNTPVIIILFVVRPWTPSFTRSLFHAEICLLRATKFDSMTDNEFYNQWSRFRSLLGVFCRGPFIIILLPYHNKNFWSEIFNGTVCIIHVL